MAIHGDGGGPDVPALWLNPSHAADPLTAKEAAEIAQEAYIYGYLLITSDVTRAAFINVKAPDPKTFQAPLNQFVSLPKYPPADYHGVTAPNADTLYSGAFLDVSKEPIILSYPDMKDRYFLFPIYSEWTNVYQRARQTNTWHSALDHSHHRTWMEGDLAEGNHPRGQVSYRFSLHHRTRLTQKLLRRITRR